MSPQARPARRAKLTNVDYAVLSSGQQIPEYSSEESSSADEARKARTKKRRKHPSVSIPAPSGDATTTYTAVRKRSPRTPPQCFICTTVSKSPLVLCKVCNRWYHDRCGRPFQSASVLGNASCHECRQKGEVTQESARQRPELDSLTDVVKLIKKAKNIIVVAGAGISVSCGIPDFRSKDGIYAMVQHMDPDLPEPECLFHIDYFRQDPSPFFQLVRNVFTDSPSPSATHFFLQLLEAKKKLLRVYTQNIDGLEEAAGLTKYIPCHGTFAWSACVRCRKRVPTSTVMDVIHAGVIPVCSDTKCRGVLKPEITFFGEILDDRVSTCITKDRVKADLLLVIGTSLKVSPVADIPGFLPDHVPQVVINKTPLKKKKRRSRHPKDVSQEEFDFSMLGGCDDVVRYLTQACGWELDAAAPSGNADGPVATHTSKRAVCFGSCDCKDLGDSSVGPHADANCADDQAEDVDCGNFVCDGCQKPIPEDRPRYTCNDCFDYDLCLICKRSRYRAHFDGTHSFTKRP